MNLTLGFSPCPNDTFIFDALVNHKIDTKGLGFDVVLEDVETLNNWALEGKLDITKLSFPAFFKSLPQYQLLNAGSALGKGVGPLLIQSQQKDISSHLEEQTIVLPGENTTANLLFSFAYPQAKNKIFMRFDLIEDYVLQHECAGVIIHENRFTYADRGLAKIADLGDVWEQKMNSPIPLGGIAVHQRLKDDIARQVDELILQSLQYAFAHYPIISPFVSTHAQTMTEEVMRKHIDLYVNDYSLNLGIEGRKAIATLYTVFTGGNSEFIDQLFFQKQA